MEKTRCVIRLENYSLWGADSTVGEYCRKEKKMLNVWVRRNPTGFETFDMEGIEELEEQLKGLEAFKPLNDQEEICAEITGPWGEIRELLSQPFFAKIWFDPESPRFKQ